MRSRHHQPHRLWKWTVLISVVLLAACTTGEKMADMRDGMTKDQVVATLGQPDGISHDGNTEVLTYANRLMSGWDFDRADYHVNLTDGHVIAYGPGPILNPVSDR
jgi:hypothetical protein